MMPSPNDARPLYDARPQQGQEMLAFVRAPIPPTIRRCRRAPGTQRLTPDRRGGMRQRGEEECDDGQDGTGSWQAPDMREW
jgi:hypothetical protein